MTAVAVGCGPMANPKFGRRHGSPPREQQPRTSHLRADAGHCITEWLYLILFPLCFKLEHFIIYVSLL
jgi:hypothetical protein